MLANRCGPGSRNRESIIDVVLRSEDDPESEAAEEAVWGLLNESGLRLQRRPSQPMAYLIARYGDEPAGGLVLTGSADADVYRLDFCCGVLPEHRKAGVARKLVQAALDAASMFEYPDDYWVRWLVLAVHPAMGKILEDLGFDRDGLGFEAGRDCCLYSKDL